MSGARLRPDSTPPPPTRTPPAPFETPATIALMRPRYQAAMSAMSRLHRPPQTSRCQDAALMSRIEADGCPGPESFRVGR